MLYSPLKKFYWVGELSFLRVAHICFTVYLLTHAYYAIQRHQSMVERLRAYEELVVENSDMIKSRVVELFEIVSGLDRMAKEIMDRMQDE